MPELDDTDAVLPEVMRQRGCAVTGLLGSGGMGWVVSVSDPALARTLALKIARGEAGSFAWQRLQREARITASLGGAGVPAVHDSGALPDGRPWFSMSLAEGRPLSEVLDAPMSRHQRRDAIRWIQQACAILAPIHRAGIIHRDLKPANILIGARATILDWGLARELSADSDATDPAAEQTREGARLGTPSRMSPEQAAGLPVDARADVWALGVLLWELLAGAPAYPGDRAPEVIARILQGPPPMAAVAWAGPALTAAVEGALAPLASRTPDAGALHDALQAALATPRQPTRGHALAWAGAATAAAILATLGVQLLLPAAPLERSSADPVLVASLAAAARDAARDGRRHQSELLAADALALGGDVALRGLLLSPLPRPILELDVDPPPCEIGEMISPDGALLVCANPGHTTGYGIDEDNINQRWRQDVEIHQLQFRGLDTVLGQVPAQSNLTILDGGHGGPIDDSARMGTGRLMPTRRPDSLLRLTASGRSREAQLAPRIYHHDERPAPCPSEHAAILADGSELHACPGELIHLDTSDLSVRARWPLPSPTSRAMRMVLDATGERVALLLYSGHHAIIDIDGAATWSTEPIARASSIAVSPSGQYMAVSTILETHVWDRSRPERAWRLPGRGKVVVFDAEDRLIVQGYERIQRWRLPGAEPRVWDVGGRIRELDWGRAGLLARRVDGRVVRWSGGVISEDAEQVATSPAHEQVAVGLSGGRVQVIGQAPIAVGERCRGLEWLDAHTLVCAPAGPGPLLIDAQTGEVDRSVGLPGSSWFTAASQGRGVVALMEWSGSVFWLSGQPPRLARSGTASWANTLALSPDGAQAALGGSWGVGLLDLDTGTLADRIEMQLRVSRVAFSPDGRWLAATSYEGDLFLYRDGALAAHTILYTSQTLLLAFSPDSRQLAVGGSDGIAQVIDLSELDRPLAEVISEIRTAWGAIDSPHGQ